MTQAKTDTTGTKQARYSKRKRSESAEVGELPPVVNPRRRELCRNDLLLYLQTYFPNSTGASPFSPDHIRAIERIQLAIKVGGYFLQVVFRGWGKSTITERATCWAVSYGHRNFVVPIAADSVSAKLILDSVKSEFESNDLLAEDFPEICVPVRHLDGRPQGAKSQTHNGHRTCIEWTAKHVVLPTIESSASSGAVIRPRGIGANIRGMRHRRTDGKQARPDLVLLDDPQTDESARNPSRVQESLATLNKAILNLGGHKNRLAAFLNGTIIQPDDFVARLANAKEFPAWQSERIPMMKSFSRAHESFWMSKYATVRNDFDPDIPGDQERAHKKATQLYAKNRKKADDGAEPTWISCFNETEISATQHAYNILIDLGMDAFMAEYQNAPIVAADDLDLLPAEKIAVKCTNYGRGKIPDECSLLTAFTDVQQHHLFWMICAWAPDFTGHVIDYGAWPEQKQSYFKRDAVLTKLSHRYAGDESGMMFGALTDLGEKLCGTRYLTPTGRELQLSRWCIDGNWRARTAVVEAYARQSKYANAITITQGRGVKATDNPFSQSQRAKKWRTHMLNWFWQDGPGPARWVTFDTNFWKKRIHEALSLSIGSRGGIQLFKATPQVHRMLADHLRAEKPTRVEAHGRTVYEFTEIPGRDNEGLDCLVGCFVAASIAGVTRATERIVVKSKAKPRKRVSYLEV